MRKLLSFILLPALFSIHCKELPSPSIPDKLSETTILISLDGFRYDYLDQAGHSKGPDSKDVIQAVEKVDGDIGQLVSGFKLRNWLDSVNIIIVSDHDPKNLSMHGIFIAAGPAFKQGLKIAAFESIYEMMCKVINLAPASNDGNLEKLRDVLRQ